MICLRRALIYVSAIVAFSFIGSAFAEAVDPYALIRQQQAGFAKHMDLTPPPAPVEAPVAKKVKPKVTKVARTVTKRKIKKTKGKKWIDVIVDLSEQRMRVKVNGEQTHSWKVSSGRDGHKTPTGSYRPGRMYKEYYSKKYYNSPMPNSIFFRGGYAIHGTFQTSALGYPASHGCVRLAPKNAKRLYDLVQKNGRSRTKIRIVK